MNLKELELAKQKAKEDILRLKKDKINDQTYSESYCIPILIEEVRAKAYAEGIEVARELQDKLNISEQNHKIAKDIIEQLENDKIKIIKDEIEFLELLSQGTVYTSITWKRDLIKIRNRIKQLKEQLGDKA